MATIDVKKKRRRTELVNLESNLRDVERDNLSPKQNCYLRRALYDSKELWKANHDKAVRASKAAWAPTEVTEGDKSRKRKRGTQKARLLPPKDKVIDTPRRVKGIKLENIAGKFSDGIAVEEKEVEAELNNVVEDTLE